MKHGEIFLTIRNYFLDMVSKNMEGYIFRSDRDSKASKT